VSSALAACLAALSRNRGRFEAFTRPATELIEAQLGSTVRELLDLGSGIGDPALALARALDGRGRVTALDCQPALLALLTSEAKARMLRNIATVNATMEALPFGSASFDAVVSRLAIHTTQDAARCLDETLRVLRPGGICLHVVWCAPEQPLLEHTVVEPVRAATGTTLLAGESGPFRFAQSGALAALMEQSGLIDVEEGVLRANWRWEGDAESLWEVSKQVSAPFYDALWTEMEPASVRALDERIVRELARYEQQGRAELPVELRWARATRPGLHASR
jgi:SAM-dependent methyltransferase